MDHRAFVHDDYLLRKPTVFRVPKIMPVPPIPPELMLQGQELAGRLGSNGFADERSLIDLDDAGKHGEVRLPSMATNTLHIPPKCDLPSRPAGTSRKWVTFTYVCRIDAIVPMQFGHLFRVSSDAVQDDFI